VAGAGRPSGARLQPTNYYTLVTLRVRPLGEGLQTLQHGVYVGRVLEPLLERSPLVVAAERRRHQVGGVRPQEACLAGVDHHLGYGAGEGVGIRTHREGTVRRDVAAQPGPLRESIG